MVNWKAYKRKLTLTKEKSAIYKDAILPQGLEQVE